MAGEKLNCWEYCGCGRQPGGEKADSEGVCPAAVDESRDGVNGGHNSGRACWEVAGTMCYGRHVEASNASKLVSCLECPFYKSVQLENAQQPCRPEDILANAARRRLLHEDEER